MAGIFKNLFKPKWQHKNPEVRINAVKQLSDQQPDHFDIIKQLIASDPEQAVIQAAIEQVSQLNNLIHLSHHDHKGTQEVARNRLAEHLSEANKAQWPNDQNQLAELIVSLPTLPTIEALLANISDEDKLFTIATKAKISNIRQLATNRIESFELLENLEKEVKGKDKGIQKIVRAKLETIRNTQKQQAQIAQDIAQTLEAIEQQARQSFQPLYEAKITTLSQRWESLKNSTSTEQQAQFALALNACQSIIDHHYQAEAEQQAKANASKDAKDEQEATVAQLETEQDQVIETGDFNVPAMNALLKTQQNRWEDASEHHAPSKALANRYHRVTSSLQQFVTAKETLDHNREALETLTSADEINTDQIKKQLETINWPTELNEPEIITEARSKLGDAQQAIRRERSNLKSDCKEAEELLDKADEMLKDGKLKGIFQSIRQAQDIMRNWPNERKINKRLRQLQYDFKEMKDWQDYAVLPKLEELCEKMESLTTIDIDLETLASQLKQTRQEWKELAYSDNKYGQALWHKFKTAADQVNTRCKPYFESLDQTRKNNLETRKAIIEQLQSYVTQSDWSSIQDWKIVDKIYKQAIDEWTKASPVVRSEVEKIQKSFDAPLNTLRDQLKTQRDQNTQEKQSLLNQAQQLLNAENLKQATDQAKELQKQWQKVGICHRRQEQQLWKEFRKVCDQLFNKRSEQWQQENNQRSENLTQAQQVIDQINQLAEDNSITTGKELSQKLRDLQTHYANAGHLPRDQYDKMEAAYRAACDKVKQRSAEIKRAQKAQQGENLYHKLSIYQQQIQQSDEQHQEAWNNIEIDDKKLNNLLNKAWENLLGGKVELRSATTDQLRELCIRCEILTDKNSPDADQSLRMSLQVERLSKGMNSNDKDNSDSLLNEWLTLDVPTQDFEPYLNRLLEAFDYK
jgi:hypothetical protein